MHDQMHFADAAGEAVIISAGKDGEVVLTRKAPGDGFLVSTNFNVANPANGHSYPCWRYDRANEMLASLVEREGPLAVEDVAGVLDAVHVASGAGWTIESMVADLTRGLVYLYYFHLFDRPVRLDVMEELAHARSPGPLSGLFPDDVRQEAARRYRAIQRRSAICRLAGMAWASLVLISLVLLVALSPKDGRRPRFWVPAVILLGPLALAIWFAAGRGRSRAGRRSVLLETLGDAMSTVVAFVMILFVFILVPAAQSDPVLQILLVFGLPLLVGWMLFHGPLLAPLAEKGYGRWLGDRLPQTLVTVNLGLGGAAVAVMPLVNLSLRACPLFPLTLWTLMIWWGIVALGTLGGGLLLYLYERWAGRRGFRAWSVLAGEEGQLGTPSWRELGWWIPLSYMVLLAGIAAGAFLSQALAP